MQVSVKYVLERVRGRAVTGSPRGAFTAGRGPSVVGLASAGPARAGRITGVALGACILLTSVAGPAITATQAPVDLESLLSEDEFGVCVPESQLDDIWLVYATKGKSGRVPHVCMSGDCEDLPDIAAWASAQQFPDDIDLERDDVVARYAAFVAEFCGPEEETPEPAPEVAAPVVEPALVPALARLLGPGEIRPVVPRPVMASIPFASGQSFFGSGGGSSGGGNPPSLSDNPDPLVPPQQPDDPGISPPVSTVPLPAGVWLLLSALGFGWLGHRRLRGQAGGR